MENSILEILTYYVIGGALLIGAPGVFFYIVFMPALQNTKGRMVGYKDHKQYGDSSIYENSPSDQSKFYLEVSWIIYTSDKQTYMPNPDALYQDMQKLDDMYEELLWHPDDELQFTHDGQKIIITNKTLEEKQ